MKQHYHSNAKTNSHMRLSIQKSTLSNQALALRYGISIQTVSKWRNRDFVTDLSCKPHTIHYALNDLAKELIRMVRVLTWMPLDDLVDTIRSVIPNATRSTVWRILKRFGINIVPKDKKEEAKKFKNYQPGFLHMDVTYLPRIEGHQCFYLYYLFNRRHSSLKKELGVRTPYEALQKWYNLEPKLFQTSPEMFKAYAFALLEQRGET